MSVTLEDFLTSFDSPLRFKKDCNIELTNNERSIEVSMTNCVMVLENGIPLFAGGSIVPKSVFDPNDVVFKEYVGSNVKKAIVSNEKRVIVNNDVILSSDNHKTYIIVPYVIKFRDDKWRTLKIEGWIRT